MQIAPPAQVLSLHLQTFITLRPQNQEEDRSRGSVFSVVKVRFSEHELSVVIQRGFGIGFHEFLEQLPGVFTVALVVVCLGNTIAGKIRHVGVRLVKKETLVFKNGGIVGAHIEELFGVEQLFFGGFKLNFG